MFPVLSAPQDRLTRCTMHCNDKAKDMFDSGAKEPAVRSLMERCVGSCVDDHVNLIPSMTRRLKENLDSIPQWGEGWAAVVRPHAYSSAGLVSSASVTRNNWGIEDWNTMKRFIWITVFDKFLKGCDSESWCCGDLKLLAVRFIILHVIYQQWPPWRAGAQRFWLVRSWLTATR